MNDSYCKGAEGTEGELRSKLTSQYRYNRFVKKMYVKLKKEHPTYTDQQIMNNIGDKTGDELNKFVHTTRSRL